jgi:hypothetical protein
MIDGFLLFMNPMGDKMYSRIFLAKVDAIESALEEALPRIRRRFGESLSLDEVRSTIGAGKLLEEATNASLRDTCASIRGEVSRTEAWIDIVRLYEKAIQNNNEPTCSRHGSVPYAHGYCPYCTK